MNTTAEKQGAGPDIVLAAGGLVWDKREPSAKLAVIHRRKYDDWTLPKGKTEPGESLRETALREVREELGCPVRVEEFAGTVSYTAGRAPKVVFYWHMVRTDDAPFQPNKEVDRVEWLAPGEAIGRLTYAGERDLVSRAAFVRPPRRRGLLGWRAANPLEQRLEAVLKVFRAQLECRWNVPAGGNDWWICSLKRLVAEAEAALARGEVNKGWVFLQEAERLSLLGVSSEELVDRAVAVRLDSMQKLRGWRKEAVDALLPAEQLQEAAKRTLSPPWIPPLPAGAWDRFRRAVMEATLIRNEHFNNFYHQIELNKWQVSYLMYATMVVLALLLSYVWNSEGIGTGDEAWLAMGVVLWGALGAILSATFQLTRVGEAKIPEFIPHRLVTVGRPLVGAASALFVFMALKAGVLGFIVIDPEKYGAAPWFVCAFAAGFSERLVIRAVELGSGAGAKGGGGADKAAKPPAPPSRTQVDIVPPQDQ